MSRSLRHHMVPVFAAGLSLASPAFTQADPAGQAGSAGPASPIPALISSRGCLISASGGTVQPAGYDTTDSLRYSATGGLPWSRTFGFAPLASIPVTAPDRTAVAAVSEGAGAMRPGPDTVPYTESGTPGLSIRFVPSEQPAGGQAQVYVRPGAAYPETPDYSRVPSRDPKYTQAIPGPNDTTILYTDPARAIRSEARVSPSGKLELVCTQPHDGHPAGHSALASPHTHPVTAQAREGGR